MLAADYGHALEMFAAASGEKAVKLVAPDKSTRDRNGDWLLTTAKGVPLAAVNVAAGVCAVLAPELRPRIASVSGTRVICACGQPKWLPGRVPAGIHYTCDRCNHVCFVG